MKMKFKEYHVKVYKKTPLPFKEYHFEYYKVFNDIEKAVSFAKEIKNSGNKAIIEMINIIEEWEE